MGGSEGDPIQKMGFFWGKAPENRRFSRFFAEKCGKNGGKVYKNRYKMCKRNARKR